MRSQLRRGVLPFLGMLVVACGSEPTRGLSVAPGEVDRERDVVREPAHDAAEPETLEVGVDGSAEHIVFDAGDASDVPAQGVVSQPQREPMPSLMGGVRYSPR
jgi:hypothetical protein